MTSLYTNQVIEYTAEGKDTQVERILHIDSSLTNCFMINVFDKKARVRAEKCRRIEQDFIVGNAREIPDPFGELMLPDESFSEARRLERDHNLQALAVLIDALPEERFDRSARGKLIQEIVRRPKGQEGSADLYRSKQRVYDLWRQYCQRGQMPNALLSDRNRAGWTQELREKAEARPEGHAKLGANRKSGDPRHGVVLNEEIREKLVLGAVTFWETPQPNGYRLTWKEAHRQTLGTYFKDRLETRDGVVVPIPVDPAPSLRQFKDAYLAQQDPEKRLRGRKGNKAYDLDYRPIHGDQTSLAYGPLMLVQADSTIADVYLVHKITREVIGRPTLTFLRDTMSRVICGYSLTWEHPSWSATALAIENMAMDKVQYCQSIGYPATPIQPEWWPCHHLPAEILADNGELLTHASTTFSKGLKVKISNTASGRGDMKGLIESGFADVNAQLFHHLPGAVIANRRAKTRGGEGPDPRLTATLDIHQLRRLLVRYILHYNRYRRLKGYPLGDDLIAAKIEPIPVKLWEFGARHRRAHLRNVPIDLVRLNTMTPDVATVDRRGIKFKGRYYMCDRAEREQWTTLAALPRNKRQPWEVKIVYDRRNLNTIYLRRDLEHLKPGEPVLEPCIQIFTNLIDPNLDLLEIELLDQQASNQAQAVEVDDLHNELEYDAHIKAIVDEANQHTKRMRQGQKQDLNGRKSRRQAAIVDERTDETHPENHPHAGDRPIAQHTHHSGEYEGEFTDEDYLLAGYKEES